MHKPEDYQTTENVARLKVSVDRTIAENRQDPEKDKEKEILYKLLDKLTPHPPVTAGSGVERDVSAFNIADDLSTICQANFRSCARNYDKSFATK